MANNKQQPSIDFFNALGDFFGKLLRADTLSDVFNVMDSESLRFFREILLSVLICQTKTGESLLDVSERRQIIEIFSYVAERVRIEKDILSPSVFSALDDTVRAFDRHILHYVVFLLEQEQKPRVNWAGRRKNNVRNRYSLVGQNRHAPEENVFACGFAKSSDAIPVSLCKHAFCGY
jgi:hypothetical protein